MKNLFIAATMLLSVQFVSAQSTDFKKDVVNYIKLSGSAAQVTAVLDPMLAKLPVSENDKVSIKKEIETTLPSLYDKMATVMMKHYTHDDIKKMIEFYNSPVGKKIQEVTPKMVHDQMQAGQEWGMEFTKIIQKYIQ